MFILCHYGNEYLTNYFTINLVKKQLGVVKMTIKIENLRFAYNGHDILRNIKLTFEKGKIYGILGLNGSGKTTLLKLMLGLLQEQDGEVLIFGQKKKSLRQDEIAKVISYVPQGLNITYDISVIEFLLMGYNPFLKLFEKPNETHVEKAKCQLEEMELIHLINKSLLSLSGGELQMVLIARALIQNTDFIIMDEPVSNLDLKNQRYVLDLIKEAKTKYKKTIIVSLHDPNLIRKYCDLAILLKDGEILCMGDVNEIINMENLKRIYSLEFEEIKTSGYHYYIGR